MPLEEEEKARLLKSFEFSQSKYLEKEKNSKTYAPYRNYFKRFIGANNQPDIYFFFQASHENKATGSFSDIKKSPPLLQYWIFILCRCQRPDIRIGQLTMRKYDRSDAEMFALVLLTNNTVSIFLDREKIETVEKNPLNTEVYAIFKLPPQLAPESPDIPKIASLTLELEDDRNVFLLTSSVETEPGSLTFYKDVDAGNIGMEILNKDDYLKNEREYERKDPEKYSVLYSNEARVKRAYELLWKDFPSL